MGFAARPYQVTMRRIIKKRLMRIFPKLKANNFRITSRRTACYNCIALAAGIDDDWWEYRPGYTWPGAPRDPSVAAAVTVFLGLGFETCDDADASPQWEKIAIFGDNAGYTHAARQLESGHWISKFGKLHDIEHKYLEDLADSDYGTVIQIMRRQRPGDAT
jgi:hypothetical protein